MIKQRIQRPLRLLPRFRKIRNPEVRSDSDGRHDLPHLRGHSTSTCTATGASTRLQHYRLGGCLEPVRHSPPFHGWRPRPLLQGVGLMKVSLAAVVSNIQPLAAIFFSILLGEGDIFTLPVAVGGVLIVLSCKRLQDVVTIKPYLSQAVPLMVNASIEACKQSAHLEVSSCEAES